MTNKASFDRDIALLAEWSTGESFKDSIDVDNHAVEIAHDYNAPMVDVWYALAHALILRAKQSDNLTFDRMQYGE